jgi:alpha-tubulin suppressor-like RCC1 family protein
MRYVRTTIRGGLALLTVAAALALARPAGAAPLTGATGINAQSQTTCAIVTGQQVRCWGRGQEGELGNGAAQERAEGVLVADLDGVGPLVGATQVDVGANHVCARLSNGHAACWGDNQWGQLGDDSETSSLIPVEVTNGLGTGPLLGVVQVTAGEDHSCATLDDSRVACWGRNGYGQLGDGTQIDRVRPVLVLAPTGPAALDDVAQVTAGERHTCARRTGGQVRCWGSNTFGSLGDGTFEDSIRAVPVVKPNGTGRLSNVVQISTSSRHTCARLENGQARCWGLGTSGQLGNGAGATSNRPVTVRTSPTESSPLSGITQLATSYEDTCFRTANSRARCTGYNSFGNVGNPNGGTEVHAPMVVRTATDTGPLTGVRQVAAGTTHSCARLANGQVRCWGANSWSQLGDGSGNPHGLPTTPVQLG